MYFLRGEYLPKKYLFAIVSVIVSCVPLKGGLARDVAEYGCQIVGIELGNKGLKEAFREISNWVKDYHRRNGCLPKKQLPDGKGLSGIILGYQFSPESGLALKLANAIIATAGMIEISRKQSKALNLDLFSGPTLFPDDGVKMFKACFDKSPPDDSPLWESKEFKETLTYMFFVFLPDIPPMCSDPIICGVVSTESYEDYSKKREITWYDWIDGICRALEPGILMMSFSLSAMRNNR